MNLTPIAYFHCAKKEAYQAARQGSIDISDEFGIIEFLPGNNFEQALEDIDGITHLWLIYEFHKNSEWKPKVLPPRGSTKKIGVFATRSPYRPNSLGLSCVQFVKKEGLQLYIKNFDLLDGTPIFDIKPYLSYADSFPEAQVPWMKNIETEKFNISFTPLVIDQILFLKSLGISEIENFIVQQLQFEPFNSRNKRVKATSDDSGTLCYRTWRIDFALKDLDLDVQRIYSGYTLSELASPQDTYADKEIHRLFMARFT